LSRARTIAGVSDADLVQYQPIFDLSNLFHLFGKSDAKAVKVDLGVDVPQLHAGLHVFSIAKPTSSKDPPDSTSHSR